MYHEINNRTYDKGFNPGGGAYIKIFASSKKEADKLLLLKEGVESKNYGKDKLFLVVKIFARKVSHMGGFPADGGVNQKYVQALAICREAGSKKIGSDKELVGGIEDPAYIVFCRFDRRFYYNGENWPVGPRLKIQSKSSMKRGAEILFLVSEKKIMVRFYKRIDPKGTKQLLGVHVYPEELEDLARKKFEGLKV